MRRHLLSFSLLSALALALYWPVFHILPLGGDNLYAMAWVRSAGLGDVLRGDAAIYPEWRPLSYLTVWLEFRLFGLQHMPLYFLVNLTAWVACAWLVSHIVCDLTGRPSAAMVAGVIPLVDRRAHQALTWIIERQTTLACLFGLAALAVLVRARTRETTMPERAAVFALLLAAMLSKEHGAAFTIAVSVYGWISHRRDYQAAAAASLAVYVALRFVLAGGAYAAYCEDMALGFDVQLRCLDPMAMVGLPQMAYNAAAAFAASLVAGLFDPAGAIALTPYRIAISSTMLVLACYGWRKAPAILLLPALLPLTIGLMGFMVYRPRNVLIGVVGLAIVAGVGLARLEGVLLRTQRHWLAVAAALVVMLALGRSAFDAHEFVRGTSVQLNRREPCASEIRERPFGASFVPDMKRSFALPDPDCVDPD